MHAGSGTADPSDVAQMAYDFLVNHPKALNSVRSKLKQVILDEYQDVSVSQHKLLRVIVRGVDEGNVNPVGAAHEKAKLPVLLDHQTAHNEQKSSEHVCFHVPKIICAGDANQSIYGWRGAAPSLTVEGFREDFPQGLVVPLSTNYRLPKHILNAANVLIGHKSVGKVESHSVVISPEAFDVSPAALASISHAVSNHTCSKASKASNGRKDDAVVSGSLVGLPQQLLLEEALMSESRSSVFIQGLWDQREEAKFIAGEIRKRSKGRSDLFTKVRQNLKGEVGECLDGKTFYDSTDVAIMVRSKGQLKLIEEALNTYRIPYTIPKQYADEAMESSLLSSVNIIRNPKLLPMKPVKLITMHMAKGDEFDDVYLAGWTEGVFPHPSSLSSNRLYEERRIAYVALTRARQRVVITHSFMKRVSYYGSDGNKKDVTKPVEPSRFLYDLMDISDNVDLNGEEFIIHWSESYGFKEFVASTNLPQHFSKSYQIPNGYTKEKAPRRLPSTPYMPPTTSAVEKEPLSFHTSENTAEMDSVRNEIETGMQAVFAKKKGAKGKYRTIFRSILRRLGIGRGSALVLTTEGRKTLPATIDMLGKAPECYTTKRPLSRCTSEQLGLYLFYLLHQKQLN
jgi:Superfamily I DNA and RNA helicases